MMIEILHTCLGGWDLHVLGHIYLFLQVGSADLRDLHMFLKVGSV